jgi:hypothetical protein
MLKGLLLAEMPNAPDPMIDALRQYHHNQHVQA